MKAPNDKHKIIIDEKGAEVIQEIFGLYKKGYSQTKIATILNDKKVLTRKERAKELNGIDISNKKKVTWTTSQISSILKNEVYIGAFIFNKYNNITIKKSK